MFLSGAGGVTVKPHPCQQHRGQRHKKKCTHTKKKKHKLDAGGFSIQLLSNKYAAGRTISSSLHPDLNISLL